MKRLISLALLVCTVFSTQFLVNCSNPLEVNDGVILDPEQPEVIVDTMIITDTLFLNDTTLSIDTVHIVDTTYLIDSSLIIDTITINDTTFIVDSIIVVDTFTNTDTVFVIDSNYVDTLILTDTMTFTDTLIVYDTSTIVDTVEIIMHDSTDANLICSQLSSSLKNIVWMYNNSDGNYKLEFSASVNPQNPERILTVIIDDVEYTWNPFENKQFDIEQFLNKNTTITISPNKPSAHGHEIDICLTITPL